MSTASFDRTAKARPARSGAGARVFACAAAVMTLGSPPAAGAASTLSYFTWGGYDDPALRTAYTAKYGAGPRYTFFSSTDEGFTKLKAGFRADVAHPCLHDVGKWKDAGLLQPIDTALIKNWNDLLPPLREAPGLKIDGRQWLVPWEWGASSVIYRTDKVQPQEQSFRVLLDPKYRGRITLPDAFDEVFQLAAVLAGIAKPLQMTEADYPKVERTFRALRDNARFIWTDPAEVDQAMASGEVELAFAWPISYRNLHKQGIPVAFMSQPKEKLVTWLCGFAYLKSSTAPAQEVYDFINALETPASGTRLVADFGFGHANAAAMKLVPPAELAELGMAGDPGDYLSHGNLLGPMSEAQRRRLIDLWETIKAGG